jgi:hypothetical protein
VLGVAIVLILAGLAIVVWHKPIVNARAHKKAQELHDLVTAAGLNPPSVETLANIYGADGGATADTASGDIARALLALNIGRTGEVNQRSILIDPRLLEFEWLVLKVYRPDVAAKYQKFVKSLKLEKTLSQ